MITYNIDELISKLLLGEISPEENIQLNDWINQSPENKVFFDDICNSTYIADKYKTYRKLNKEVAYNTFLVRTRTKSKVILFKPWMKVASVAILVIALSLPFVIKKQTSFKTQLMVITPGSNQAVLITEQGQQVALENDSVSQIKMGNQILASNSSGNLVYTKINDINSSQKYNTLIVPRGGEYRLTLSDGTKIHLNAASEIRYPIEFGAESRDVYLKGEAYFEIEKDEKRPFYVHINNIQVKQYGTAFNVNGRSLERTQVTLVHGSISLIVNNNNEYQLQPSQLAEYSSLNQDVTVSTVDVSQYVGWNEGKFIFEDKTLGEIMETLSIWYNFEVQFNQASLKEERFTGNIQRNAPIENILNAIRFSTQTKFNIKNRTIYIDKE